MSVTTRSAGTPRDVALRSTSDRAPEARDPVAVPSTRSGPLSWVTHRTSDVPKFETARVSKGYDPTEFKPTGGYALTTTDDLRSETISIVDGRKATFTWHSQNLSVDGPQGRFNLSGTDEARRSQLLAEFKNTYSALPSQSFGVPAGEGATATRYLSVLGNVGKLVSLNEQKDTPTGVLASERVCELQTFDLSTGQRAKLDDLLSPKQFQSIVQDVTRQLTKKPFKNQGFELSAPELRAAIRDHFTIRRDSSGMLMIDVGWAPRPKPFYGEIAKFTFRAPTDPETLARLGVVSR